jgi:hypothetical protein
MAKVLVVANRTAESPELLEALRQRAQEGEVAFTLLVPATPHGVAWVADMHSGGSDAESHMLATVERLRAEGLEVSAGRVGDPDPVAAVQDEVNFESYDEIVVSTLPGSISKWLKLDLPHRVERSTGLPVTHVVASEVKVASG